MDIEAETTCNGIKRKKPYKELKPTASGDDDRTAEHEATSEKNSDSDGGGVDAQENKTEDLELMEKSDREIAASIDRIKRNLQTIGVRLPDGGEKYKANLRRHEYELERRKKLQLEKAENGCDETIQLSDHSDDGASHGKKKSASKFAKIFGKKMEGEQEDSRTVCAFEKDLTSINRCDGRKLKRQLSAETTRNGIKRKKPYEELKPTASGDDDCTVEHEATSEKNSDSDAGGVDAQENKTEDLELMEKSDREIAASFERIKRNLQTIGVRLPDGGEKYKANLRRHEYELERRKKLQLEKVCHLLRHKSPPSAGIFISDAIFSGEGMLNNSEFGQHSIGGEHEDEGNSYSSGKHHSYVWDYFDLLPVAPNGDKKAKCSACGRVYVTNACSGTSNLRRHIPKCFDIDEPGQAKKQKRAPLDQAMYREKLAISIIKHNYPFSYVEHEETRNLHKFLHGDVKFITRNTAKADVLKIYEREKMILKDKLEKVTGRICLTSDLWSSITTDGFMALTAHYVDENWNLRKKVLNFRVIPPPHSGSILAEHLINFLADWGIEKKVFTITLDNAKYNDILVYRLKDHLRLNNALVCDGDFTHVRCSAHVLDLIVQAGLKVIEGAIEKVRESVKYVRASTARKYKFAECIQILSLQCGKHVRQDIVTRWNSTYLMLHCALAYRRAYTRLALVDSSFQTSPSEEEWVRVEIITRLLKPFYEITTLFSGSSYPTSNLYFHHVWRIRLYIEKEMCNVDQVISGMAKDMKEKFDKYWKSYSMILSFAAILDPRYKVKLVEYCFSKLNMTFKEREEKLKRIVDGMHKLYDKEYNIQSKTMHDSLIPESSNVGGNMLDELDGFDTFLSQYKVVDNEKSQLTLYLEEPSVDRKVELDVLQYWKDNQVRYPKLAVMARDILSIPITTVASESSFSIGGRVLSKYRTSLLSSNVEALLCTRDWLFDLEGTKMKTITKWMKILLKTLKH
ncbi:putative transcription factor/ chromatin remodeling BED-type(Zn) family [Helianthus debilis subsp. tardiflorus]